jgi:SAM-dependent methyltransferase
MPTAHDIKIIVSRYWGGRAAGFDLGASHGILNETQHQAWLALLRQVAGPAPLKVLDVGCGTGFLAMRMAELGHTAVGIDLSVEMLAEAQRKADTSGLAVTFRLGDAEAPPTFYRPSRGPRPRAPLRRSSLPHPEQHVQAVHCRAMSCCAPL